MGYQKDQSFAGTTYRPGSQPFVPPPLPPRPGLGLLRPVSPKPPSYEAALHQYHSQPLSHSWSAQDPRKRSSESLVPSGEGQDGRRTLLLIYIHGFLGNETSFQSFPAHIHNILTTRLISTHTVHTKIYPRYKSRKAIEYARDDFSNWLCPHENSQTDVVLLGHSMGGILSAEVALLQPYSPASKDKFRHHILGTVDFDTPFLGMHPGVIVSGIGSLFRPKQASPTLKPQDATGGNALMPMPHQIATPNGSVAGGGLMQTQEEQSPTTSGYFPPLSQSQSTAASITSLTSPLSSLATPSIKDPNYDPPFPNDVRLPVRKGWDSTLHFITKHSDGLTKATKSFVTSHLEFGGALADYRGLKARYERLRALEDVDDSRTESLRENKPPRRIRFVNYYTASTGRLPPLKPESEAEKKHLDHIVDGPGAGSEQQVQDTQLSSASAASSRSGSKSPRKSIENPQRGLIADVAPETNEWNEELQQGILSDQSEELNHLEPGPIADEEDLPQSNINDEIIATSTDFRGITQSSPSADPEFQSPPQLLSSSRSSILPQAPTLPPLPSPPTEPASFDPISYTDKDTRKLAEKDHARQIKAYQRAVKDRDKAIKDRRKLLEKRERVARQERDKAVKDEEKLRLKEESAELKAKERVRAKEEKECAVASTSTSAPGRSDSRSESTSAPFPPPVTDTGLEKKEKRDRKFCMLPSSVNGQRDPCWPRVFMEDMDEVGAHCGLFIAGKPHYEGLVMDVGGRVEGWVLERWRRGEMQREDGDAGSRNIGRSS